MRRLALILGVLTLLAAATYFIEGPGEMNDLEIYYKAGIRFRQAENLYPATDGHFEFKYPPIAAVPFVLVSLLPLGAAKVLWLVVLVVALGFAFERLWRAFPAVSPVGAGVILLVLARCFEREFANGQVNALLLLLVTLGFERIAREDDRLGGVLLAAAGLFKPHLFAFVPYLLLLRRTKAASAALVVFSVGLLAPVVRYGSEGLLDLYRNMNLRLTASTARLLPDTANASLPGLLTKLTHGSPRVVTVIAFVVVGAVLWGPYRRVKTDRDAGTFRVFDDLAILMPAVLLLSPQAWDFTAFTAAAAVFAFVSMRRELPKTLVLLGAFSCIVLAVDMKLLLGRGATFERVMHFSPNAWVLLCLFGIAVYIRTRVAKPEGLA